MSDYISRQTAIDALGERPMVWTDNDNYSLGQRNQYDSDRLAIETVPSAQPERKRGKWVDDGTYGDYHPHHAWHCSECGENVIEIDTPWFKFCPNCGADMREGLR